MTDTRPKIYFGKILSSSCMQQIVVARITPQAAQALFMNPHNDPTQYGV